MSLGARRSARFALGARRGSRSARFALAREKETRLKMRDLLLS
jgi:hypothetical protein